MRILHCCLAAFYIDDFGYQENILPKMHKLQGHEVRILASTETYIDNFTLGYLEPKSYINCDGIQVTRIPYVKGIPHILAKKLRIYNGVWKFLRAFQPQIIFIHDLQFLSIHQFAKFARQNPDITIFVDGHADYVNSARNWISRNILHKIIYKFCARVIEPYVEKFYGVLPARVDFLKDVYKISAKKVELLVMGGDLTEVDFSRRHEIRNSIRRDNGIGENDFLIITGGKIDIQKNIHLLINAVLRLNNNNIKLIVFGKIDDQFFDSMGIPRISPYIKYVGWLSQEKVGHHFLASDLAFFPGTHSTLWEHSAAFGLPGVFKSYKGMHHVDVGGNALFLENISIKAITQTIVRLSSDRKLFERMTDIAIKKGIPYFSYYEIAKRAIDHKKK